MTRYRLLLHAFIGGDMNFESNHLTEWLNSGVDEELIALNVQSLSGTLPYDYLL